MSSQASLGNGFYVLATGLAVPLPRFVPHEPEWSEIKLVREDTNQGIEE